MVMGELTQQADVVVVGGGPGGYGAAFRAADLGLDVTLVEAGTGPGGACLFRGCIPSKTYLQLVQLLQDTHEAADKGIRFDRPEIDLVRLREWKNRVVASLASGLENLCRRRGIQVINGKATFEGSNQLRLQGADVGHIRFRNAVLAVGSEPVELPGAPFHPTGRVIDSTAALELEDVPDSLLVVGGGYIGLELGMVYAALGSRVTLVELEDRLLPGVDADLVAPLHRRLQHTFKDLLLSTRIDQLTERDDSVEALLVDSEGRKTHHHFARALVAVGRRPSTDRIGLETTSVELDARGFVTTDSQQRTADPSIFAVGDVAGGVMLAHKAVREGKVAAEVIAKRRSAFDARAIPAVVYTHPQIAWCGLTENQAREQNLDVTVQRFPWSASGRAATMDAADGLTKVIADTQSRRILGMGITGRETEALISEGVLAIEMGALTDDLALSIHPHPTLSETESEAAELFDGSATHLFTSPKKDRPS